MTEVDVCIVGGGLSGLACAYHLHKLQPSLRVVVLEARDRVGGRTFSVPCGDGVVDVGGQWIGSGQVLVKELALELGLKLEAQPWLGGDQGCEATSDGRSSFVADIPVRAGPADVTAAEGQEVARVIEEIDTFALTVPLHTPWTCDQAKKWDSMTVEDYFRSKQPSDVAMRELRLGVQTILASEPRDLSFLYFLFFVHAAGGFRNLSDGPGGAQHYKVATGMQSMSLRLADRLRASGVLIMLNTTVRAIRNCENGTEDGLSSTHAVIYVDQHDGGCSQYLARRVVVAMPPPVAAAIDITPACGRQQLARAMHMGACIKVICVYKKAFWRLSLEAKRALDLHYSELGPVSNIFDATVGQGPALVGLVVGDTARAWSARADSALFRGAVLQQYSRMFASRRALQPTHFVVKSWLEVSPHGHTVLLAP